IDLVAPSLEALVTALLGEIAPTGEPPHAEVWERVLEKMQASGRLGVEAREGSLGARVTAQLRATRGETGAIKATLFTPVDPGEASDGLLVRVTSAGRLLEQCKFASAYPGRTLHVELPTAQPSTMRRRGLVQRVAEVFAGLALPVLR